MEVFTKPANLKYNKHFRYQNISISQQLRNLLLIKLAAILALVPLLMIKFNINWPVVSKRAMKACVRVIKQYPKRHVPAPDR